MGERGEGGVEMEIWGGGCKLKCEGFWFRLAFYAASLMLPHLFIYGDADAVMSFRIVLDGAVFGTACCLLPAACCLGLGLAWPGQGSAMRAPSNSEHRTPSPGPSGQALRQEPEADGMCSFLEQPGAAAHVKAWRNLFAVF